MVQLFDRILAYRAVRNIELAAHALDDDALVLANLMQNVHVMSKRFVLWDEFSPVEVAEFMQNAHKMSGSKLKQDRESRLVAHTHARPVSRPKSYR